MRAVLLSAILLIGVASSLAVTAWVGSRQPALPHEVRDISGGVPIQRGRIDDFIERIRKETDAETAANLNSHEDNMLRAMLDPYPIYSDTHLTEVCLSNRRLARVYEHLMKLSEAQRSREAMELFDKSLVGFQDKAHLILTRWEEDNPPQSPQELFGNGRSFDGYRWALACRASDHRRGRRPRSACLPPQMRVARMARPGHG